MELMKWTLLAFKFNIFRTTPVREELEPHLREK
jgi:hypothetical protein